MHKAWKQLQQALAVGSKQQQQQQQQSKGDHRRNSSSSSSSTATKSSNNAPGQRRPSMQGRSSVRDTLGGPPPRRTSQFCKNPEQAAKGEEETDTYDASMGVPADLHSLPIEHRLGGKLDSSSKHKYMLDTSTSSRMTCSTTCSTHFTNDSSTSSRLISVDSSSSSKYSYCGPQSGSSSSHPSVSKALCTPQDIQPDSCSAPGAYPLPTTAPAYTRKTAPPILPASEQPAPSSEHGSLPEHTRKDEEDISLQQQQACPGSHPQLAANGQRKPEQPAPANLDLPLVQQQQEQQHQHFQSHPLSSPAFPLQRGVSLPDAAELQASHPNSISPIAASAFGILNVGSLASISCSAGGVSDPLLKAQDMRSHTTAPACPTSAPCLRFSGTQSTASDMQSTAVEDNSKCSDKQAGLPYIAREAACASSGHPSHASTPNPIPLLTPMVQSQQSLLSSSQNSNSASIPVSASLTASLSKGGADEHPSCASTAAAAVAADDEEGIDAFDLEGAAAPASAAWDPRDQATKHTLAAMPGSTIREAVHTATPSAQQQQQQLPLQRPPVRANAPLGRSTLSMGLSNLGMRTPNPAAPLPTSPLPSAHKPSCMQALTHASSHACKPSRMQALHHQPKPAPPTPSPHQFQPLPSSLSPTCSHPSDNLAGQLLNGCEPAGPELQQDSQQRVLTTPDSAIGVNPENPSPSSLQLSSTAASRGGSQPEVPDAQVLGSGDLPAGLHKYLQGLRSEPPSQSKHLLLSRVRLKNPELQSISAFISSTQNVRIVTLSHAGITDQGIAALLSSLQACPTSWEPLWVLDLRNNLIGDEGAELLASCLPLLPNLAHLVLTANNLSDAGVDALRQGLLSCRRSVCRMRVRLNPSITEGAVKELGSVQKSNRLRSQINGSADAESGQDMVLGEMDGLEGSRHSKGPLSAPALAAAAAPFSATLGMAELNVKGSLSGLEVAVPRGAHSDAWRKARRELGKHSSAELQEVSQDEEAARQQLMSTPFMQRRPAGDLSCDQRMFADELAECCAPGPFMHPPAAAKQTAMTRGAMDPPAPLAPLAAVSSACKDSSTGTGSRLAAVCTVVEADEAGQLSAAEVQHVQGQAQLHKEEATAAAAAGAQTPVLQMLCPEPEATSPAAPATAGLKYPNPATDSQLELVKLLVEPALPLEHNVAKSLGTIFLLAEHKAQQHPSSKSHSAATVVDASQTELAPQSSMDGLPSRFSRLSLDATMHVRTHQEEQHEQERLLHSWLTNLEHLVDELAARGFGAAVASAGKDRSNNSGGSSVNCLTSMRHSYIRVQKPELALEEECPYGSTVHHGKILRKGSLPCTAPVGSISSVLSSSGLMEWSRNSASQVPALNAWPLRGSKSDSQQEVVLESNRLMHRMSSASDDAAGGHGGSCWRRRLTIDTVPEGEELSCATGESNDLEAACDAPVHGSCAVAGAAAAGGAEVGVSCAGCPGILQDGGAEGRQRRSSSMESTMRGRGRLKYQGSGGGSRRAKSSSGVSGVSFAPDLLPQRLQEEGRPGEQHWLQQLQKRQQQSPVKMVQEVQEQPPLSPHSASRSKSIPGPSNARSSFTPGSAASVCTDASGPSSTGACGITGSYIVVDPSFREQFELRAQCATPRYEAVLALLPKVYVGHVDRLPLLVELLCEEMTASFKACGLPLPPWRKLTSLLSKWHLA